MPQTRRGQGAVLAAVALIGIGLLARDEATWFPQSWAPEFYALKALAGVAAVVTTVVHMSRTWPHVGTLAQRLRYLLLLAFIVVVASASSAQYDAGAVVTGRNLAAFLLAVLATPVALLSIRQDNRKHPRT